MKISSPSTSAQSRTAVFVASDSKAAMELQRFYKLTVNGTADYDTWLALLVSTGNNERAASACDVSVKLDAYKIQKLKGIGCQTVGRYLSNTPNATELIDKELTVNELNTVFDNSMSVFLIMQE
ncbi:MAG: hypothetical protein LBP35_07070 [Candidatus Ancillula trichonymphae]|jgi:hypothetical protein|nr:hypothetical protein [Candidatus Ancillula trichonymphae]